MKVTWLGGSSILIEDGKRIYIDPYFDDKGSLPYADIILVSDWSEHGFRECIEKLRTDETIICGNRDTCAEFDGAILMSGQQEIKGVKITTTGTQELGFVIDKEIYYLGDAEFIPKEKVTLLIMPIGLNGMNKSIEIVNKIKPEAVLPIHWGGRMALSEDEIQLFSERIKTKVLIIKPGEFIE